MKMAFVIHSPEMKIEKNSEKLRNKSPKITAEEKMKIGKNLPHGSARGKFIQLFVCVLNVVVVVIRFLSLMSTKIALSQKLFFSSLYGSLLFACVIQTVRSLNFSQHFFYYIYEE